MSCHWGLVVVAGGLGFAAGAGSLILLGPDLLGQAQAMLTASEQVGEATEKLRGEVAAFLSTVAA